MFAELPIFTLYFFVGMGEGVPYFFYLSNFFSQDEGFKFASVLSNADVYDYACDAKTEKDGKQESEYVL